MTGSRVVATHVSKLRRQYRFAFVSWTFHAERSSHFCRDCPILRTQCPRTPCPSSIGFELSLWDIRHFEEAMFSARISEFRIVFVMIYIAFVTIYIRLNRYVGMNIEWFEFELGWSERC